MEGADIKAAGSLSEHASGFGDGSGSGLFAFGRDDGSATFAFGFGLFGHSAFHVGGEFNVLELDVLDVDAPFVGLGVDNFADLGGNFVTFAENFI